MQIRIWEHLRKVLNVAWEKIRQKVYSEDKVDRSYDQEQEF